MSENPKKLFLLDAFALIYRAYFAFINNPRVTSKGIDTSAVFGFTTTLLEVLDKQKPTHIAVIRDTSKPTVRHEYFEAYKANRDETPEAIKISIPYIQEILDAFNIPFIGIDGYEADDVIGTLAQQAEKEGFEVFMMTPDKDFGQLVTENIKMYRPGRMGNPAEIWGISEIQQKFGIERVEQVVDYLGMMGDAVDNIPGFPGVGPKTAQKLLAQYGSMENMLAHAHEIKGKLGEKIRDNEAQGILSKKLAKILTDAPVQFNANDFLKEDINEAAITQIFETLEFRTLLKKVIGNTTTEAASTNKAPASKSPAQTDLFAAAVSDASETNSIYTSSTAYDHFYQIASHPQELKLLLQLLNKQNVVSIFILTSEKDTETYINGFSFSYDKSKAYYVPINNDKNLIETFKLFFENEAIEKVSHNLKTDISLLHSYGIHFKGKLFDTTIAHYIIQPDMRHNLDVLSETYLGYKPQNLENLIGKKGKNQKLLQELPLEDLCAYAGESADIIHQLKLHFDGLLEKEGLHDILSNIEIPLIPVLADMEREGINLDTQALAKLSEKLTTDIEVLEKEIKNICGIDFNLASPKQLGEVLFEHMKLMEKPKKTKTGQYSTSEDILLELAKEHEVAQKIVDYRQLVKLKSTYVDSLPLLVNPKTKRIHTSFNQAVAATGRLSSNNPNLQNIPIRTVRGQEVRKCFIAKDSSHYMLAADYSQIELRLIAELSQDKVMMDAFLKGEDIHTATAAKVFNVALSDVSREQRSNAKTVNFGIIYGVSAFGLSQQTTLTRSESSEIIKSYFQTYPDIRDYIESQKELARSQGYVETLLGRKRYLKDINSKNAVVRSHAERNAVNAPIQGSAADIIKLAMIQIQKDLIESDLKTKMLLQVHDELVFDTPKEELEIVKPLIKNAMENAVQTKIPLLVEFGHGNNWLEAH